MWWKPSDDPILDEGLEQHSVLDVAEHLADAVCVGGAGEVRVQGLAVLLPVSVLGLLHVPLLDELLGLLRVPPPSCGVEGGVKGEILHHQVCD